MAKLTVLIAVNFILLKFMCMIVEGAEEDIRRATCEFDFENINELLDYLPPFCKTLKENGGEVYELALEESKLVSEFENNLKKLEKMLGGVEQQTFWDIKKEIYEKVNLYQCNDDKNIETDKEFFNCLITERKKLNELLVEKIEQEQTKNM